MTYVDCRSCLCCWTISLQRENILTQFKKYIGTNLKTFTELKEIK